jgi:Mn2+/Fe2+ NRAMP family transporter
METGEAISICRMDTVLAVCLGGLVTFLIMATSAATAYPHREIASAADMASQLEPLFGGAAARICFAVGLCAAGLTSAVTAPLAAAYATTGALGWRQDLRAGPFRGIWAAVLVVGTVVAATSGKSPAETILLAQVANGILLPIVAVILLLAVNRKQQMGPYVNSPLANLLGVAIVVFALGLGLMKLLQQFGVV